MSNQYEVLGKAPGAEDLKKLSPNDIHLTIKNMNAGYGKMEILHNFDLFVSKAQSLCLIGPNGAGKSTILHSIYGFDRNTGKPCKLFDQFRCRTLWHPNHNSGDLYIFGDFLRGSRHACANFAHHPACNLGARV